MIKISNIVSKLAGKHFKNATFNDKLLAALINTTPFSVTLVIPLVLHNFIYELKPVWQCLIDIGIILYFVFVYILFRVNHNIKLASIFITIALSLFLYFIFITGDSLKTAPLWLYGYPIFVLMLLGFKRGKWFVMAAILALILTYIFLSGNLPANYGTQYLARFVTVFVIYAVYLLAYIYAKEYLENQLKIKNQKLVEQDKLMQNHLHELEGLNFKLKQNERRIFRAQEIGQVGIWEYNWKKRTLSVNDRVLHILGMKIGKNEVSIETILPFLNIYDLEKNKEIFFNAVTNEESVNLIQRVYTIDEEIRFIECFIDFDVNEYGERLIIGIVKDVTIYKKSENTKVKSMVKDIDLERKRMAHELHDSLGQVLTGVVIRLDVLLAKETLHNELSNNLLDIKKLLMDTIEDTRTISYNLMPKSIDDFGFEAALKNLISIYRTTSELEIKLYINESNINIPKEIEHNLFRITQEILDNCNKHSKATKLFIQLIYHDSGLIFTIEDNGIGFNIDEMESKGLGLSNIKNRVGAISGELMIDSNEKGTIFTVEWEEKNMF